MYSHLLVESTRLLYWESNELRDSEDLRSSLSPVVNHILGLGQIIEPCLLLCLALS